MLVSKRSFLAYGSGDSWRGSFAKRAVRMSTSWIETHFTIVGVVQEDALKKNGSPGSHELGLMLHEEFLLKSTDQVFVFEQ